jgi:hypothetical protein
MTYRRTPTIPLLGLVLALLTCGGASVTSAPRPTLEERCQALLAGWKRRFEAERLTSLVASPFVIAGDGGAARLQRYRDGTILAAARALRATYFKKEPSAPILILLFESEAPYRRLAKQWFNDEDVAHFGYFRRSDHAMLMNVGTGTGTLVHELTHALMEPDFPEVPDWFNEGLASLYEQCSLDGDRITGHPNWRLPGLQKVLRAGTLRPLEALIKDGEFYNEERTGINYAQARYLMLYLQEQGLLSRYYQQLRAGHKNDPTGLGTLKKLVGPKTLEQFEKEWRAWVLTLRFN